MRSKVTLDKSGKSSKTDKLTNSISYDNNKQNISKLLSLNDLQAICENKALAQILRFISQQLVAICPICPIVTIRACVRDI